MYNNTYLYHHGIKGQKWGVRRYQNADGTLTPEGLKKYRKDYDKIKVSQLKGDLIYKDRTGVSFVDKYNQKYYINEGKRQTKQLIKKIGNKGFSQLDREILKEGKKFADEYVKEAERLYTNINTQNTYNHGYDWYMKYHRVDK